MIRRSVGLCINQFGITNQRKSSAQFLMPAEQLLIGEDHGFALDFVANNYALRITPDSEIVAAQLGDEWNGLAIDFERNAYVLQTATTAETLFGDTPASQEPFAVAIDFLENSYAVRT